MTDASNKSAPKRRRGRKSGDVKSPGLSDEVVHGENVADYQAHKSLLIQLNEEEPTWFEYGKKLPGRNSTITSDPPAVGEQSNGQLVSKYRSIADSIVQKEMQLLGKGAMRGSDEKWVENTMKKGTLKDRIAAMSVTVSTDPVHKFYALDGLMQMVGCSESGGQTNSRVAQMTAEALEDLFLNTFLPSDRKLVTLSQRPFYRYENKVNGENTKKSLSPRILLLWRFEEMVKDKYELFLRKYMAQTLQDGVEMQKIATLRSAASLLKSVPEGESQILSMIANKLGDPMKKTAAAAGHQLRLVVQEHPKMQIVIAREVQQLAHRPHLSPRALYSCIVFLNQLKLEKDDFPVKKGDIQTTSLPASLIKTYFKLFEVAINKGKTTKGSKESGDEGMKSRLLSALLTGVNRAHPYLPDKDKDLEEHVDALYKVVHTSPPAAATQALMLLFHVAVGSHLENTRPEKSATDAETGRQNRFYSALYASLSHEALLSSGKHLTMYFNLLYKAMKYDSDENRVHAFTKRIMCTALHCSPAVVSGSLFLLNELSKTHVELRKCFEEPPNGRNANVVLDVNKRDPRSALVVKGEEGQKSNSEDATVKCPPCWELALLTHHFHPSVNKFARTLGEITYAGDPLKDFGLAPFLDKFAYKNPKSKAKLANHYQRGESIAERRSGTDGAMQAHKSLPVNDPSFLRKDDVNEQDVFFHKFFVERARRDDIKGIVRGKPTMDEDEMEDVVMDAAEEAEGFDGGLEQTFEEYERGWETDEEEEAFVDQLAESLMEDTLDDEKDGNDLDDEDPDMDDWGDLDDDDEEEKNPPAKAAKGDSDSDDDDDDDDDDEADEDEAAGVIDEDAFMDDDDDEGDEDEAAGVIDEDAFMDDDDDDNEGDSNDDSDADDLAFAEDDSDSDPEHAAMIKLVSKKGKKYKNSDVDVFADADDYEEKISKSWSEAKRAREPDQEEDPVDKEDEEEEPSQVKETKSAKKRRRRNTGKQE